MRKKLAFRKTISRLRGLLCLFVAMAAVFASFSGPQEFQRNNPLAPLSLALSYLRLSVYASTNCALTSGASQATVDAAITAAGSGTCTGTVNGNTVTLAQGTYGPFSSTGTIPCNAQISAPAVSFVPSSTPGQPPTLTPKATLTGSASFTGWAFQTTAGCSSAQTIQYLEWNGMHPPNGGGFLKVVAGTANLNVYYSWLHGANAPNADSSSQNEQAQQIWMDGSLSGAVTSNVNIKWNYFGTPTYQGDCAGAMLEQNTEDNGGYCGGVGMHNNLTNVAVEYNIASYLEEPFKFFESQGECNPVYVSYNFIQYWQRIGFETQCNSGPSHPTNMFIQYNSFGNNYNGNGGQQNYPLSAANGCTGCVTHADYNIFVANTENAAGHRQNGIELWGDAGTTANYNYFSGYAAASGAGGVQWSEFGNFTMNNNTFNMYASGSTICSGSNYNNIATGGYWNYEKQGNPAQPPVHTPVSCQGNTYSSAGIGTLASAAPSISPATGGYSFPVTVTITNPGLNRDTNTTDWYTTDGSNPVPGSGTALPYTGPITLNGPATVKAVGMWGALNQPRAYATNYGYVPSTVVSNNYTSSGPTAATPIFSPLSENYTTSLSVSISDSTPSSTIHYTTDGSVPTSASAVYSGAITVTAPTTTVKAIATASGFAQSLIASATYVNTAYVATPTFSPGSENFTGTLSVSIADTTSGASVYYTTDGSTPSTSGGGGSSGATYYLSPSGNDSNSGTSSGSPWLSPNHALNCGDQIIAASGSYSASNFYYGKWGTVTCAANNNVAWLKCVTFDTCKISVTSGTAQAMVIDHSYWGVQGWENSVSASVSFGSCFEANPSGSSSIHHIVFANNVANGCATAGFQAYNHSATSSVDYLAFIGNIAYNAAQGSSVCGSGFSVDQPIASDSNAGTHIYFAGNFAWHNVNPATCAGTAATDGEGIIFDTFDFSNGGGTPYTQQAAAENNLLVANGGRGIEVNNNNTSSHATFFLQNNTAYGNNTQAGQAFPSFLGEIYINQAYAVSSTADLAMTSTGSVGGHAVYAFSAEGTDGTSTVLGDWLNSAAGNNTLITASPGFSYGANVLGSDPAFHSTTIPGAPSCSGAANVPACVATLIASFTPTTTGAVPYGYQKPVTTPVTDPLFPAWLCNTNLPAGLVSTPCTPTSELYTGSFTIAATTTVKALAAKSGFTTSPVAVGTYTVGSTVAATPTFSPDSETYITSVTVTLADTTSGASIYYTTDGSTPTTSSTLYTAPFAIMGGVGLTTTVNAIAVAPGFTASPVGTATYLNNPMTVSTPTFSPDSEEFTSPLTVTISDSTGGTTIYYTRDGTTPTTASSVYSAPLPVATSTTLKAIAAATGYSASAVGQAVYATLTQASLPPGISPGPHLFASSFTATIAAAPSNPGATIYYTTDGTMPTTSSTVYHGPITISTTTTLNAIAVYGSLSPSLPASTTFTFSTCPGCWWNQ